jgi:hypothetical protein
MTALDFMKAMRTEFGMFEFRATTGTAIVESTNCQKNPRHPFNRPDSEYIIPATDHRRTKK